MFLTTKIQIYPTQEQIDLMWELSDINRKLYNYALDDRKHAYENNIKGVTFFKQQKDLTNLKKEHVELKNVHSRVLMMTLKTLDSNFKSFYVLNKIRSDARPPYFKSRKYFTTMKYNQNGYKFADNTICLSHNMKNRVKLLFDIQHHTFGRVKQVDLYLTRDEKWFISIIEEIEPPQYLNNDLYQAWDLGVMKQTGVNTNGKFIEIINIRPDKYWNCSIDVLQSRRDHCKKHSKDHKPSKRWKHYKYLQRKLEKKRTNQLINFQHKLSRKIVDNTRANTIILGDLDVKSMTKSKQSTKNINRSTQGTGYLARFAGYITYKAELKGKKVIYISEYNTSKQCCCCGKIHTMTLKDRIMSCDCGNEIDRDKNAAVNIMMQYLSQNAPRMGYQQFVDNLRNTGLIISVHSQETQNV